MTHICRLSIVIMLLLALTLNLNAAPKPGYYTQAEGKKERTLKSSLSTIISAGYRNVGYDGLYNVYKTSDVREDGKVWDMYSTCTWTPGQKQCGNYSSVCDCYNREHSVPQSWFDKASPMVSDAFHIYPTDGKVNGQRSNYPFGECSNGSSLGGKALGRLGSSTFPGYSGTVFEPVDEYKGDFARTYFYFVTRYESKMSGFNGAGIAKNSYPSLPKWCIDLFLKWHHQDPVSPKETTRNDAIEKHQNNRNPFIDYPELAEHIWGSQINEPWYMNSSIAEVPLLTGSIFTEGSTVHITGVTQGTVVTIVDINGSTLLHQPLSDGDIEYPLAHKGVFIIKLANDTQYQISKVIVP